MKKEYRNSTRTRKMIRSAFVDLIDEKKLISNITVAELADRADIAKAHSTIIMMTYIPLPMR